MVDPTTHEFIAMLRSAGVTGDSCDEWQVKDVEQTLGVELPPAYKAFLLLAGRGFGPFQGSQYAIEDDLSELQRAGASIFRSDRMTLPASAFVFFVHQGVAARFFLLGSDNDPAVFEYVERWPPAKQLAPSFSEFLLGEVRGTP